jgi:hypothetical protein
VALDKIMQIKYRGHLSRIFSALTVTVDIEDGLVLATRGQPRGRVQGGNFARTGRRQLN